MRGGGGAVRFDGGRTGCVTLTFRRAILADIPSLHTLIEGAYRGETARRGWTHEADLLEGQRTDIAALTQGLCDPRRYLLVGEIEGTLIACAELTDKGSGLAYVGLLTVDPLLQREGLGRTMLAAAERIAAMMISATTLEMTVIRQRRTLIDWYHRRGYAETGERRAFPYGDQRYGRPTTLELEFVVMSKQLIAR